MVTAEVSPLVKVGGLADAVAGLAGALSGDGHGVEWFLPGHRAVMAALGDREGEGRPLALPMATADPVTLRSFGSPMGRLHVVDAPGLFDRPGVYTDPGTGAGYEDDAERFALFASAACLYLRDGGSGAPDLVHCHDHPAALVPALLRHGPPALRALRALPVVFTIHNLAHQGAAEPALAARLGLDPALIVPMGPLEYHGGLNPVKGAIELSDRVTTVSPTYASEICSPGLGAGLEGVLQEHRARLRGILNGVDTTVWSPETDRLIVKNYGAGNLAGKAWNRRTLLQRMSLEPAGASTAVLGMISRLDEQKGIRLVLEVMDEMLAEDVRLVVLGMGSPVLERALEEAAQRHPGRLAFRRDFSEELAHQIEAGSNIFLMPSLYEPCGLNQMYSLLYGTVPVVRATGGLADTVFDPDEEPARGNGFVFRAPLPVELLKTVRRALRAFRDRRRWRSLVGNGMAADYSWSRSAREYVEVYLAAIDDARRRAADSEPAAGINREVQQ